MPTIDRILLEVCSACQYTCDLCAHQGLRDSNPRFQMTIEDLGALIEHFKKINCQVHNAHIHGPGEPLLWKNFNEGVRLLVQSNFSGLITIVTNGFALSQIAEDLWPSLYVLISKYPDTQMDQNIMDRWKGRWEILDRSRFLEVIHYPHSAVWSCICDGPCYYNKRIYRCGPPSWDAARRAGMDINTLSVALEDYDPGKKYAGPEPPCLYCWANIDLKMPRYNVDHKFKENK